MARTSSKPKTSDVLQELADDLDDFVAASVVGADGMSVANLVVERDFDEEKAAAALSQLVKQANESAEAMEAGKFEETITSSERYMFITRPIGNGKFFTQVVLKADGNIGAARMYINEYEEALLDTLPRSAQ
jgi:predicted regulator of Ras-like GTPase activity (Roadblock/LC7/MglB family)